MNRPSTRSVAVACGICLLGFVSTAAQPNANYVPDQVIIKFRSGTTPTEQAELLAELASTEVEHFDRIDAQLATISAMPVQDAVTTYGDHPMIDFIEPNYIVDVYGIPNDPLFDQLWGMHNTGQTGGTPGADIRATIAWDITTGTNDVVIGVIDTGVNYLHPDLAANIYSNPGEIPGNGIDDDSNGFIDDVRGWDFLNEDNDPMDDHSHGSHVAGTIGAVGDNDLGVAGVNWTVRIMPLKFLSAGGFGSTADAIECVEYATMMGVHLTNNSWGGGGFSSALQLAIEDAGAAGILFVAAAGNGGANIDSSPHYPASYPSANIVSVANTDHNDQLWPSSNFGVVGVDLGAPGASILSTVLGTGYGHKTGTSMASPHVAGALGLIYDRFPGITGSSAKDLLLASVDSLPSLAGRVLTGGRLNAFTPILEPDSLPPAMISDLDVIEMQGTWARLQWTATGDDGTTGDARRYEVRYSTAVITEANFDVAALAPDPPDPQAPGATEEMQVGGLAFSTPYYFAVKAFDELGNSSPLSNVPTATTLDPPNITVAPDSLSADLLTGASSAEILTVSNDGEAELNFEISIDQGAPPPAARRIRTFTRILTAPPDPTVTFAPLRADPYDGGVAGRRAPYDPAALRAPAVPPGDVRILLLQSGADVLEIQAALSAFPDISTVDVFDGSSTVPTLATLLAYDSVFLVVNTAFGNPVGIGNVLADYADTGGGVVMTLASFISGWHVQGRFLTDGYLPFELGSGPIGSSTLGPFDASHPIMDGVTTADGDLLGAVSLAAGAELVAGWTNGQPFVATQGTNVAAVNIFVSGSGYWAGDVPLVLRNAARWSSSAIDWLSPDPEAGVVPSGGSVGVVMTFDATGLNGGDYNGLITVASDDPDLPEVTVPAHMNVTGAPDIEVSETMFDFGPLFLGATADDTLEVSNAGTDLLTVSSVSVDHPDYAVDVTSFALDPGESRRVVVTFSPTTLGVIPATLTIESDDPDEATVLVSLTGAGVEPPVITVSPDSLAADLLTGETSVQTLTIANDGGSDLDWTLGIQLTPGGAPAAARPELVYGQRPVRGELLADDLGANDQSPETPVTLAGTYTGDFMHFGISDYGEVMPFQHPIGNEHLQFGSFISGYNVSYLVGGSPVTSYAAFGSRVGIVPVSYTELEVSPTRVVVEVVTRTTDARVEIVRTLTFDRSDRYVRVDNTLRNISPGDLEAVIFKSFADWDVDDDSSDDDWQVDDTRNLIAANDITFTGLASREVPALRDIDGWDDYRVRDTFVDFPGGSATNFDGLAILHFEPGDLAPGFHTSIQTVFAAGSDLTELREAVDRGGAPPWLAVEPTAGTVPAGSSADVTVTFDAAGLFGGDYSADLRVSSNDPLAPEVVVPATLHVTGAPDIHVSPLAIDFGETFIGASPTDTVNVSNVGTDLLTVSDVSLDHSDYAVDVTSFALNPGENQEIVVTFSPTTAGVIPATLTVTSDDSDEATVPVSLTGDGLVPPVVTVSPDSLTEDLFTGETSVRTLTIANDGGSDLDWTLDIRLTPGPAPAAARPELVYGQRLARGEALADGQPANGQSPEAPVVLAGTYTGDFMHFGISDYGEIMPFQQPVGNEHLQVGSLISGYNVSYLVGGSPATSYAAFRTRSGLVSVSYTELEVSPTRVVVEVVVRTTDSRVEIVRTLTFVRSERYIRVDNVVHNISPGDLEAVIFKSFADWDVDDDASDDDWQVDDARNLIVASDVTFTGLASREVPALRDIDGWDDYRVRNTFVDFPGGSATNYDGLAILHFEPGDLSPGSQTSIQTVFAAGNDLLELQEAVDRGIAPLWIEVEPVAGTVPAGTSADLTATFDAAGLFGGDYLADLQVSSNDPLAPEVVVPVALHVTGAPEVVVSPTELHFGDVLVGANSTLDLLVSNVGTDRLSVSDIVATDADYVASPTAFEIDPFDSQIVQVTFAPSTATSHPATLTLEHNAPVATTDVPLTGEGLVPPEITVAPASFSDSLFTGGFATHSLTLGNVGGSNLYFEVEVAPTTAAAAAFSVDVIASEGGEPQPIVAVGRPVPLEEIRRNRSVPLQRQVHAEDRVDKTDGPSTLPAGSGLRVVAPQEEIFGNADNGYGGSYRSRGNIFRCTTPRRLSEHRFWLHPNLSAALWMLVYEGESQVGTYDLVSASDLSPGGTDPGWYSSGDVGVDMLAGRYYLIVASFSANSVHYNQQTITPYPIPASFGELIAGAGWTWSPSTNFPPFATQSVPSTAFIDPVAYYQTIVTNSSVSWVGVSPDSGTVPVAADLALDVTFDAAGLAGGDYDADIVITSNDPDALEVAVPAFLHVTGAPDIALSDSTLSYGTIYVGVTSVDTVRVSNEGTEPLNVTSVGIDHSDYSVDTSPFALAPGEGRDLAVTFGPTTAGTITGALTIECDDPDESVVTVSLDGEGVFPPVVSVTPDSLAADLFTGEISSQTLSVANEGGAPLDWQITVAFVPVAPTTTTMLTAPVGTADGRGPDGERSPPGRTVSIRAAGLDDLTGVRILWDRSHSQQPTTGWETIVSDLTLRGAEVVESFNPITPGHLAGFDILWTIDSSNSWTVGEAEDVAEWIHTGGSLLIEGDQTDDSFNLLLATAGAGIQYGSAGGAGGTTSNIFPHATTQDVSQVWISTSALAHLSDVVAPAGNLVNDIANVPAVAYADVGTGRVMALSDELFFDNAIGRDDNQLFANQAIDWLAGSGWLLVDPASGSVPGGSSTDVTVTFDATNLFGGDYLAHLFVSSNDPITPDVTVPASLHVTGAPDISVEPLAIDFGQTFLGVMPESTVVVANAGTDLLTVSNVTLSHSDYSVDVTSFSLDPGESQSIVVTFAPTSAAVIPADLTIESDDPDESSVIVSLTGEGVEPPIASVTPTSLVSNLLTNETETQVAMLHNTGGSDLVFTTDIVRATSVTVHEAQEYEKGAVDPRQGFLGYGGPDGFGYTWVDSDDPRGPTFDWVDIRSVGTRVPMSGDDRNSGPLPIGFSFPYYENSYDTFRICSNGWISFTSPSTQYTNQPLPSSGAPENLLALFWDDLHFPADNAYYHHDGSRLVIQFQDVPHLGGGGPYTMEIILYPSGRILYQYLEVNPPTDGATIGFQNATQDDGLTIAFNASYVHDELAILISAAPPWLRLAPESGTVPAGASLPIEVTFDATGLFGGIYVAAIDFVSNDPVTPALMLPATLNVTGVPDVAVSPTDLDFGDLFVGASSTRDLLVTNTGTDLLSVSDITSTDADYVATPTSFDLEPFEARTVEVTFTPSSAGTHPATLTLSHNAPSSTTDVPLDGTGLIPPEIGLDPAALAAAALPEGQKLKKLRIHNAGGSPLEWSLSIQTISAAPPAGAFAPGRSAAIDGRRTAGLRASGTSDDPPPGYEPIFSTPIVSSGATVLIVQDHEPWGSDANETLLALNGIAFDMINSSQLATTNLSGYRVVLIPSDQRTSFYSVIASRRTQIDDFVLTGGTLQFHAAGWGWNSGDASLVTLPGGMGIERFSASMNEVLEPAHALMAGVPNPFFGSSASHSAFTSIPAGALAIARGAVGRTNLVEYPFGRGRVVTGGQTFEFGHDNGQDPGIILRNMIPYTHGAAPNWLLAEPSSGVVAAGASFDVEVAFDATELEAGDYEAEITFASNDPTDPAVLVPVIFHVGSIAAVETKITPETLNDGSQGNWITARVELPAGYDASDVVLSTVRCQSTIPADEDFDPSGSDVLVKFDRAAVQAVVPEADDVELVVTGEIRDTIYFVGTDSVRVIRPQLTGPNGGEILATGAQFEVTWNDPPGFHPERADVYYTVDDTQSWEWIPIAVGVQGTSVLWIVPDVVTTNARARVYVYDADGVFAYDSGDDVFEINTHSTDGPIDIALPGSYALYQNAPNPFRPSTEIRFDLPRSSPVELRIFDVSGRLVNVLVRDHTMPGGTHAVRWDGADRSGGRTAAGIYFYKLEAGEFRATRRMVKLR